MALRAVEQSFLLAMALRNRQHAHATHLSDVTAPPVLRYYTFGVWCTPGELPFSGTRCRLAPFQGGRLVSRPGLVPYLQPLHRGLQQAVQPRMPFNHVPYRQALAKDTFRRPTTITSSPICIAGQHMPPHAKP